MQPYTSSTPASCKARAQVSKVTPVVRISSIKMTFFGSVSFFSADFLENFFAKEYSFDKYSLRISISLSRIFIFSCSFFSLTLFSLTSTSTFSICILLKLSIFSLFFSCILNCRYILVNVTYLSGFSFTIMLMLI